jgi:hypothetical protein
LNHNFKLSNIFFRWNLRKLAAKRMEHALVLTVNVEHLAVEETAVLIINAAQ